MAGYDRTFAEIRLRDGRMLRPAFPAVAGWRSVTLSRGRRTIRVPSGVELDLGATAKALAADRAAATIAAVTGVGALGEFHHIVDPRTGRPADTPWRTVSVAASSCVDANAASTAAVALGARAPAWLESASLPTRLAAEDGRVTTVAGWPAETP
jgi:thiamine biosynthesis lipoprotein